MNKKIEEWFNEVIVDMVKNEILEAKNISDWYHTFWELYKHRFNLYIALCKSVIEKEDIIKSETWTDDWNFIKCVRSKIHEDWLNVREDWGMFLLCLHTPQWQISYHLDNEYWDKCDFAETQEKATIPFDWHTSDDVLERLLNI